MGLEALANEKYGAYDEQVQTKARLLEENVSVKEELKAMVKQLEAEQGNISEYHEKQAKIFVKKDIEDIEIAIQKLEQEKTNRDHTIRSLNDEVANQDEVINKLNKEKKHLNENAAKAGEDLQVAEDKVNHLNQIKNKLEQTLDELEGSLDKEKRGRANVEKERRKVERQARAKAERQRSDLARELENLGERLTEASGATA